MFPQNMNTGLTRDWLSGPLIVGAGPSGLAGAACLSKKGVPVLILEKENCIASLWRLRSYYSLKLHLPKKFCQHPHTPFPKEYPAYPTKQQCITYLDGYAKHFSVHPMFGHEVRSADYNADTCLWWVVANGSEYHCRWLIITTGDNAAPRVPELDGLSVYGGKIMHSSDYKNGVEFKGRKVLVVGCGNSGMEISLNLCHNGAQVSLVVRHKVVGEVTKFTSSGVEFMDGKEEEFVYVILLTCYTSNADSWLKEESLSGNGHTKSSWLSNMKGKKGIYRIGFTGKGLPGASIDAERAAEDIARQWNSYKKHLSSKINHYMQHEARAAFSSQRGIHKVIL